MASMKEIAARCNVSVATVSKAINGYSDIGEDTRNLILNAASEMGYLPNSSARALKTKRSYNLGVLFFDEGMSGLKEVTIPSGVTEIGENAFRGCTSLAKVTVPIPRSQAAISGMREGSAIKQAAVRTISL